MEFKNNTTYTYKIEKDEFGNEKAVYTSEELNCEFLYLDDKHAQFHITLLLFNLLYEKELEKDPDFDIKRLTLGQIDPNLPITNPEEL